MIKITKSQPAPPCLEIEKAKNNGDCKCNDVIHRLKEDFFNKCYLCETKEPASINIEHFRPKGNDKDLEFDWNNLFWACNHCNKIKSTRTELLNCTSPNDNVEMAIRYFIYPFPKELTKLDIKIDSTKTQNTKKLLLDIYNGKTDLSIIESANIRSILIKEIQHFQNLLTRHYEDSIEDQFKSSYKRLIIESLSRTTNFAAFKRWIIRDNGDYMVDFGQYIT